MIGNLSDRKFRVYDSGVNLRKSFSGLFGIIEKEKQSLTSRGEVWFLLDFFDIFYITCGQFL